MRRYVFIVIALVILSGCGIGNRKIKMSVNPYIIIVLIYLSTKNL
jgi:hypothetical protein